MRMKLKTRKAPAKRAASKAATKQAPGEPKREVSGIRNIVSRWHWLEANQTHRANLAKTEKEYERLIAIHNDEQREIESALAQVVPKSFLDACCLLEFATERQGGCMAEGTDVAILKNVVAGLRVVWRGEIKAARNDGMEEMRRTINFMTENANSLLNGELAIRRSLDIRRSA
jgi:hypothetical protein